MAAAVVLLNGCSTMWHNMAVCRHKPATGWFVLCCLAVGLMHELVRGGARRAAASQRSALPSSRVSAFNALLRLYYTK